MASAKDCHALITYFIGAYKHKMQANPVVNRVKARWQFSDLLSELTPNEVKGLIDYFFLTESDRGHSLEIFMYTYDKLLESKRLREVDAQSVATIRSASAERARLWRERKKVDNG